VTNAAASILIATVTTVVESILSFNVVGLLVALPSLIVQGINLHTSLSRLMVLQEGLQMQRELCQNVVPLLGSRNTFRTLLPRMQTMVHNMDSMEDALNTIRAQRIQTRELMDELGVTESLEELGMKPKATITETIDAVRRALRSAKMYMSENVEMTVSMIDSITERLQVVTTAFRKRVDAWEAQARTQSQDELSPAQQFAARFQGFMDWVTSRLKLMGSKVWKGLKSTAVTGYATLRSSLGKPTETGAQQQQQQPTHRPLAELSGTSNGATTVGALGGEAGAAGEGDDDDDDWPEDSALEAASGEAEAGSTQHRFVMRYSPRRKRHVPVVVLERGAAGQKHTADAVEYDFSVDVIRSALMTHLDWVDTREDVFTMTRDRTRTQVFGVAALSTRQLKQPYVGPVLVRPLSDGRSGWEVLSVKETERDGAAALSPPVSLEQYRDAHAFELSFQFCLESAGHLLSSIAARRGAMSTLTPIAEVEFKPARLLMGVSKARRTLFSVVPHFHLHPGGASAGVVEDMPELEGDEEGDEEASMRAMLDSVASQLKPQAQGASFGLGVATPPAPSTGATDHAKISDGTFCVTLFRGYGDETLLEELQRAEQGKPPQEYTWSARLKRAFHIDGNAQPAGAAAAMVTDPREMYRLPQDVPFEGMAFTSFGKAKVRLCSDSHAEAVVLFCTLANIGAQLPALADGTGSAFTFISGSPHVNPDAPLLHSWRKGALYANGLGNRVAGPEVLSMHCSDEAALQSMPRVNPNALNPELPSVVNSMHEAGASQNPPSQGGATRPASSGGVDPHGSLMVLTSQLLTEEEAEVTPLGVAGAPGTNCIRRRGARVVADTDDEEPESTSPPPMLRAHTEGQLGQQRGGTSASEGEGEDDHICLTRGMQRSLETQLALRLESAIARHVVDEELDSVMGDGYRARSAQQLSVLRAPEPGAVVAGEATFEDGVMPRVNPAATDEQDPDLDLDLDVDVDDESDAGDDELDLSVDDGDDLDGPGRVRAPMYARMQGVR